MRGLSSGEPSLWGGKRETQHDDCVMPEGNDLEFTVALCVIGDFVPIIIAFRCRLRESG